jgi:uncharacterized protein
MEHSSKQHNNLNKGFHVMAKPIGPICNLDCTYCFYTEKEALFPKEQNYRMSDEILEAYIRKNLDEQEIPEITFAWQGGEPTLMGLDFFRKAIKLQKRYNKGKKIINTFQTNGILLDDEWCEFLAQHNFLIGLSLDGPEDIHDKYRYDHKKRPTFQLVIRGLRLLQKHNVEYNILACVNSESSKRPLDVYHFFKEKGVKFIQFIPIVERKPDANAEELDLKLAVPPALDREEAAIAVTPWTVEPAAYSYFMRRIIDEWVRHDVGKVFVMNFEWALNCWMGLPSPSCFFAKRCGDSVIIEHNGDIYSCDHFMYPQYRLGNILTDDLKKMIFSKQQLEFGAVKETTLPKQCQQCDALFVCNGGCPKHRFLKTYDGEPGLNYLCKGYDDFFRHIHKYMKIMVKLLNNNLPVANVMKAIDRPLIIK